MANPSHSPAPSLLAPSLSLGPVSLNVRDTDAMARFYAEVLGLTLLREGENALEFGLGATPIVTLHHTPDLVPPFPGDAGLYHLAILYPSRGALARAVQRVLTLARPLFAGSADHLVSEAFYLSDPEGNGVELYCDRDPSAWTWEDGLVKMASVYIPPEDFVRAHAAERPQDAGARMGHVHLKVGSVEEARRFYVDTLGFTVTARMPSALFVSVNGYHHHLGMNSWESEVATARRETLGLRSFALILPKREYVAALRGRVEDQRIPVSESSAGITFADPWENRLTVAAAEGTPS